MSTGLFSFSSSDAGAHCQQQGEIWEGVSRVWSPWVGLGDSAGSGVAAEPLGSAGDVSEALAIPAHVFKKGPRGSPVCWSTND